MKEHRHRLEAQEFGKLSKTESNARARIRLLILHQYSIGERTNTIASLLSIHPRTALRTKNRYLERGIDSIYDQPKTGRHSKLAKSDEDSFKKRIVEAQEQRSGGRLTADDIQKIAKEEYRAHYTRNGIYELLKRIGMTWMSGRSQHPKADEQAQEAFKKTS